MASSPPPSNPSLGFRVTSALTFSIMSLLCRGFIFGLNKTEVIGLERFLEVLDKRKDVQNREKGLITVSNHLSVLDDPLIWGVLPLKYAFHPDNHRWGLGSYDICFKNKITSTFFTYGQVLPTHRLAHSPHGGLFQPTMTQAIRLLSSQPFPITSSSNPSPQPQQPDPNDDSASETDPFLHPTTSYPTSYTTNGIDTFPSPSAYPSRTHSWVHIFPEGRIHQHPALHMRYFKWGIARLILESDPLPDIVPMWIDGTQGVMHEARKWPRWLPRVGNKVRVAFGDVVDGKEVFGELRERWRELVQREMERCRLREGEEGDVELEMGELTDELKFGREAVELRIEVTRRVRDEVLKMRRDLGYDDEDPKGGLVETWREEGRNSGQSGRMGDGSWVGDT